MTDNMKALLSSREVLTDNEVSISKLAEPAGGLRFNGLEHGGNILLRVYIWYPLSF